MFFYALSDFFANVFKLKRKFILKLHDYLSLSVNQSCKVRPKFYTEKYHDGEKDSHGIINHVLEYQEVIFFQINSSS